MHKYISLLRGINVGGRNRVKMDDLRLLYQALGFKNITTYIQSGNVIFESTNSDTAVLKAQIEKQIAQQYGFFVHTETRDQATFKRVLQNNPFEHPKTQTFNGKHFFITFLSAPVEPTKVNELQKLATAEEQLVAGNQEMYIYSNTYGTSKLSNNFVERKLGVNATTRNWATAEKLYLLSKQ